MGRLAHEGMTMLCDIEILIGVGGSPSINR